MFAIPGNQFYCLLVSCGTMTTEATQILEAVTLAAQSASEAAKALREANDQKRSQRSGFSEVSKVVKCPTQFGNANSTEDQSMWLDLSFAFKQWLYYAEPGYESDLVHVEDHLNTPVVYVVGTAAGGKSKKRSRASRSCQGYSSIVLSSF